MFKLDPNVSHVMTARFEVAEQAVVTETYSCNKQIDWLATATT
jgi:hypothetical protein